MKTTNLNKYFTISFQGFFNKSNRLTPFPLLFLKFKGNMIKCLNTLIKKYSCTGKFTTFFNLKIKSTQNLKTFIKF